MRYIKKIKMFLLSPWYAFRRFLFNRKVAKEMTVYRKETIQLPWTNLRLGVEQGDDTAPAAGTSTYTDVPSNAYTLQKGMNAIEIKFSADSEDTACTAEVFVVRTKGDIKRVASLAITSGAQIDSRGDNLADTIVVTSFWLRDIFKADADGNDHMATIAFDVLGAEKIFVVFTISTAAVWNCDISGF